MSEVTILGLDWKVCYPIKIHKYGQTTKKDNQRQNPKGWYTPEEEFTDSDAWKVKVAMFDEDGKSIGDWQVLQWSKITTSCVAVLSSGRKSGERTILIEVLSVFQSHGKGLFRHDPQFWVQEATDEKPAYIPITKMGLWSSSQPWSFYVSRRRIKLLITYLHVGGRKLKRDYVL